MGSMTLFQAGFLGWLQALGEFLPISSSAHLILVPWFLGWPDHSVLFDLALHWGTALALLVFFGRDWAQLIRMRTPEDRSLLVAIIIGCIPAGVVGLLAEDWVEHTLRSPFLAAWLLIVFGLILGIADRKGRKVKGLAQLTWSVAWIIGCFQVLALFPGVSRSGITITAGLVCGFTLYDAARFSFLLSTPLILASSVLGLKAFCSGAISGPEQILFLAGFLSSFFFGLLVIRFFMEYLKRGVLDWFILYRIGLGVTTLLLVWSRW